MAAIAYFLLQSTIIAGEGRDSLVAQALGRDWKGKVSPLLYLAAIGLAYVRPSISILLYALVAATWLVPDRRMERALGMRTDVSK